MEWSALVYVLLTAVTVALGLCVDNCGDVPRAILGGRVFGSCPCDRRQARNRVAAFAVFCLLAGVSACRIAVGNDYWVYRENFKLIFQNRVVASEFGFNIIVKWMQGLFGYDEYLFIFGLFSILTAAFFVKALCDQGSDFAFSLYLLMTGGYYFNSLNSVRYYFALAVALFSMKYVLRGEYGKFALVILGAATFHKSVLLVIPAYLAAWSLAKAPLRRWHYAAGLGVLATLVFGQGVYKEIIFFFYPFYRNSEFDNGQLSYANILKCACVLLFGLVCCGRSLWEDGRNRFYFFLNLFGLAIYCCGSFIPEVSRVGYYLIISQVFLLPELLGQMREGWLGRFCRAGVVCAFGGYFFLLLRGMYALDIRLLPYRNWIFQ